MKNSSTHSTANGMLGTAISPTVPTREHVTGDHDSSAWEQVREPGEQRPARDRRPVGKRIRERGEKRRVSPAIDQDGDGDLGELIACVGEHLRGPDRAEIRRWRKPRGRTTAPQAPAGDGLSGWPGLRGKPAPAPPGAWPGRASPKLSSRLSGHGLGHARASARVSRGMRPVSPSNIADAPVQMVTSAEIFTGCHHCVILISLTVPDASDL